MRWILGLLLVMGATSAWAQLQPEVNWERYNKIRRQQKKEATSQGLPWLRPVRPGSLPDTFNAASAAPSLKRQGSNANGDVYVLPQDNMPMLKPLAAGNAMLILTPAADSSVAGQIPNGLRVQRYRFKQ